jgi:integrase
VPTHVLLFSLPAQGTHRKEIAMGVNVKKVSPNKYFINVRVRRPTGGEDRIRETFAGTKVEAEARYSQLRKQLKDSRPTQVHFESFADLLRFYEEKRGGFSYKDKSALSILEKDLGNVPLAGFPARLEAYIAHQRKFPCKRTGKPYSNASINRNVAMIRAAFNSAVVMELLEKNPISVARFPKLKEVPRDAALSPEAIRSLLNVMEKHAPHLLPMTRFALQVPCRKSELVNMRREDLDLFNNAIRVRNGTTKNDLGIWKPIPPDMVHYFRNLPVECPYLFYRMESGAYHKGLDKVSEAGRRRRLSLARHPRPGGYRPDRQRYPGTRGDADSRMEDRYAGSQVLQSGWQEGARPC